MDISLEINCLKFKILISNKSKNEMPINFGLHPYFNISDFKNIQFINYPVNCQNQKNNTLDLTKNLIKNIDKGIDILTYTNGKSILKDFKLKRQITLINPYPFELSVIWSDPPRNMICLEPWTSPRNSLKNKSRRILIPSQGFQELFATISINDI